MINVLIETNATGEELKAALSCYNSAIFEEEEPNQFEIFASPIISKETLNAEQFINTLMTNLDKKSDLTLTVLRTD